MSFHISTNRSSYGPLRQSHSREATNKTNLSHRQTKMESNLKRRLSETEDSEVTKFKRIKMDELCANAALKSSIQIVYEIKQVQPIKFEMVSSQGPAHKPLFTFKLVFNYTDTDRLKEFCGEGYSKKNAKISSLTEHKSATLTIK